MGIWGWGVGENLRLRRPNQAPPYLGLTSKQEGVTRDYWCPDASELRIDRKTYYNLVRGKFLWCSERPRELAGEFQGVTTIALAIRTPERLRVGPDLPPKGPKHESLPLNAILPWQLPASTAPRRLRQAETGLKRKRTGTDKYR